MPAAQYGPALAFDGTNGLAVWSEPTGAWAARFDARGSSLDANGIQLTIMATRDVVIARGDGRYLVVSITDEDVSRIEAIRVDNDGTLIDATPTLIETGVRGCATGLSMKKARRVGATETFSVSVDPETKKRLKSLAMERHAGNVSALITELAVEGERRAAFERAWHWYGGPEPTGAESTTIRREWEEGWALARGAKKAKRKKAAA